MDCEKFEPLLLDELYEELDELTSAAVKRHVAGCSRCAGLLTGMKATRRAVVLPIVPVPLGLEERILAATREAQKVVPIKNRFSRALSVAGSWAMRPQTAMAAVFLLMVGSSAFLIRSKNYASRDGSVAVTVAGAPAPTVAATNNESLDDKAAAAAHGPSTPPNIQRPPVPTPAASLALADPAPAEVAPAATATAAAKGSLDSKTKKEDDDAAKALGQALAANDKDISNAGGPAGGAPAADEQSRNAYSQSPMKPSAGKRAGGDPSDAFSQGAAAFRGRNFAEATRQFDQAAQTGDTNAALWAAESTREGQGCAVALGRFVQLAQKASGSWVGNEASLRAAKCQIAMGQLDAARDRLGKLAQVTTHAQAAQQALGELNQVAARRDGSGGPSAGAAAASPKRTAAPARPAPVKAPNAEAEKRQEAPPNAAAGF